MSWRLFQKPKAHLRVQVPKSSTALQAAVYHRHFVELCMAHGLSVQSTSGSQITVSGRPKPLTRFRVHWETVYGPNTVEEVFL